MTAYVPTNYVNGTTPAINATDLNHVTAELKLQANAVQPIIANSLPTWANGVPPAVSDAAPLNEMERVCQLVAQAMSLSYTPTAWGSGWTPARNATRLNHLETQVQANRAAIDALPAGNPYTFSDYSSGLIGDPPWSTIFYDGGSGFVDLIANGPVAASPDGRVSVVNDPAGSGTKVLRLEIRDSDPGWPVLTDRQKSEVRVLDGNRTWNQAAIPVGGIRWFSLRMYCPWTVSEKFEVAQGSNDWNSYIDLHSTFAGAVSATQLGPWGEPTNQRMYFRCFGGFYDNTFPNYEEFTLWNITDNAGAPILANHNRWITIVWGQKYNPDNTGWMEIWVDGVNVLPRKNRPTMWTQDTGTGVYLLHGLYNSLSANFPVSGKTVVYYGRLAIGMTKADVE
jgi:hypothetical protein